MGSTLGTLLPDRDVYNEGFEFAFVHFISRPGAEIDFAINRLHIKQGSHLFKDPFKIQTHVFQSISPGKIILRLRKNISYEISVSQYQMITLDAILPKASHLRMPPTETGTNILYESVYRIS